jgi:hypothetical protein
MLLAGKRGCEQEKEKGRRKVKEKRNNYPEILGIIEVQVRRITDLVVEKDQTVNDNQDSFH